MNTLVKPRHTFLFFFAVLVVTLLLVTLLQGCGKDEESATQRTSRLLRSATGSSTNLRLTVRTRPASLQE